MRRGPKRCPGPTPIALRVSVSSAFSANHPLLSDLFELTAADLLLVRPTESAKLRVWLAGHPDAGRYIIVRQFQQLMDQTYCDVRQTAIKGQAAHGVALALSYDQLLLKERDRLRAVVPVHPASAAAGIGLVRRLWRDVVAVTELINSLQDDMYGRLKQRCSECRITVATLVGFLCAADAIPADYVPAVNYGPLMSTLEDISNSVADSPEIESCRARITELTAKILAVAAQQAEGGLGEWRTAYDQLEGSMRPDFDSAQFVDFLNHPKSNCSIIVNEFVAAKTVEAYRGVSGKLVERLGGQDNAYIQALVSNAFAGALAPQVKADGGGTMDGETLNFALDLFLNDDPRRLLSHIADRGVAGAVEALITITSGWREVLRFAHDLTSDESLSQRQADARAAIGRLLAE